MPAAEASELLARFAAGSGSADVCTDQGRAVLRGAVRAYGAEMEANGVTWPTVPGMGDGANTLGAIDVSVLIAFTAGFVDASDFHGPARQLVGRLSFAQWPEIRSMRQAARVACPDVIQLQQAAARFVLESERLRDMADSAGSSRSQRALERLQRQSVRVERAQVQMQTVAAVVEVRMDEAT